MAQPWFGGNQSEANPVCAQFDIAAHRAVRYISPVLTARRERPDDRPRVSADGADATEDAVDSWNQRSSPADVRATLVKAVALLALIVAVDIWATHNFGLGVTQLVAVGGVVTLLSATLPLLKSVLSAAEQKAAGKIVRRIGGLVLWTPLVLALYAAGGIVAITLSTVRVTNESSDSVASVTLTYPDTPGDSSIHALRPAGATHMVVRTTPFGRAVRVNARGFVPTSFTVYPLTGLAVSLGRDVPVTPALLFRPEHNGLVALKNGGMFKAWIVVPAGRDTTIIALAETSAVKSSFLVGEPHAIPGSLVDEWRGEVACDIPDDRNRILLYWRRPTLVRNRVPSPGPGKRVRAEVRAVNGDLVSRSEIVLSNERLIDMPVLDVDPDPGNCR